MIKLGNHYSKLIQSVNKFKEKFLYPAGILNFLFVTKIAGIYLGLIIVFQDYLFSGKMEVIQLLQKEGLKL